LNGSATGQTLTINTNVDLGNKVIGVSGNLSWYGAVPNITQTRLAQNANVGDK